jgi:hypothetical protein
VKGFSGVGAPPPVVSKGRRLAQRMFRLLIRLGGKPEEQVMTLASGDCLPGVHSSPER